MNRMAFEAPKQSLRKVVIMAGGEGVRFAPLSTPEKPKQFHNIVGHRSFLRQTFERAARMVPINQIYIMTQKRYEDYIKEYIPEVSPQNIIVEDEKRNTGPALFYFMHCVNRMNKSPEDFIVACLPSDHFIKDENAFIDSMNSAFEVAEKGCICTLGMKPTFPSVDYGYIDASDSNAPWSKVIKFTEKPDEKMAQKLIEEGCFWNAGIFVWKYSVFMAEFFINAPGVLVDCVNKHLIQKFDSLEFFKTVRPISIDFALMERSGNVAVVPASVGWSDVGSWTGLKKLKEEGVEINEEASKYLDVIVDKPWGHEEIWAKTDKYVGKILFIKAGRRLSLQFHQEKSETIRILSGKMELLVAKASIDKNSNESLGFTSRRIEMSAGDVKYIPPKHIHRMKAITDCFVLEVSTPELDDVVRLEDDYGREDGE